MKTGSRTIALAVIFLILLTAGCAKQYRIVQDLERPVPTMSTCRIGTIIDELPVGFKDEDRPTAEEIAKFKGYLLDAMIDRDVLDMLDSGDSNAHYVIRGAIIDYKKGSGATRFFIGFGAGNAEVVVKLEFLDVTTNEVLFSANLTGKVSSGFESGDQMFKTVSANFSKALAERIKEQAKDAEQWE